MTEAGLFSGPDWACVVEGDSLLGPAGNGEPLVDKIARGVQLSWPRVADIVDCEGCVSRRCWRKETLHDVVPQQSVGLGQQWLDLAQEQAVGRGRVQYPESLLLQVDWSQDAFTVHHVYDDGVLLSQTTDLLLYLREEILMLFRHSCKTLRCAAKRGISCVYMERSLA